MDSLIIAVRSALLIIVTGTFAVMWSGDRSELVAVVDRPAKVLVGRRETLRNSQDIGRESLSDYPDSPIGSGASSLGGLRKIAPLPDGIRAGTYLVVDQFGRTETQVVSPQDASLEKTRNVAGDDHYSIEMGGNRWHFIRLEHRVGDHATVLRSSIRSVQ